MAKKWEIEKKFYCKNQDKLIDAIEKYGMCKKEDEKEKDEYFTDLDSEFIRNRTCLRLRETDDKLTLTFKGKSAEFGNTYSKIENDIKLNKEEYKNICEVLTSLGFYSYTVVNKKRITYTKKKDDLIYNIMIDSVKGVGSFVEFEILYYGKAYELKELQEKLDKFIQDFKSIKFENANLPYRDFVAQSIYENIKPQLNIETLLLDFDGTLVNTEKIFFNSFKRVLYEKYNIKITYDDYRENELDKNACLIENLKKQKKMKNNLSSEDIMKEIYQEYKNELSDLIITSEEIANFKLLNRIKKQGIKIGLVSTSKREYIDIILNKLKVNNLFDLIISREDVNKLKPDSEAYLQAIKQMNATPDKCLAVEDSKRGIKAAMKAHIKVIKVNPFSNKFDEDDFKSSIDKVSRLILILINHI